MLLAVQLYVEANMPAGTTVYVLYPNICTIHVFYYVINVGLIKIRCCVFYINIFIR